MNSNLLNILFNDVYKKTLMKDNTKAFIIKKDDEEKLEKALEDYIMNVMGYSVIKQYHLYQEGKIDSLEYFREIRIHLANIVNNIPSTGITNIFDWIDQYTHIYNENIEKYHYVELLINGIKSNYAKDDHDVAISNKGDSYIISKRPDKHESQMPATYINNIKNLNDILETYIQTILESNSYFNRAFLEEQGNTFDEAVQYILTWTLKNATASDLTNLENYFRKYTTFINDTSLDEFSEHPQFIGQFMGDELFLFRKRSTVVYETPYYLAFLLKNKRIELPNVRMGIEDNGEKKIAHILATQTSQSVSPSISSQELDSIFKKMLPKSKNFREFNPSHLVSLVPTIGLLNGMDIKDIEATEYLPLRYQKLVLESNKSEEELNNYQHRLTNKYLNNFFRMLEFCKGIEISNYPGDGIPLNLYLNDEIEWDNEFLQKLYEIGYHAGIKCKKSKSR